MHPVVNSALRGCRIGERVKSRVVNGPVFSVYRIQLPRGSIEVKAPYSRF